MSPGTPCAGLWGESPGVRSGPDPQQAYCCLQVFEFKGPVTIGPASPKRLFSVWLLPWVPHLPGSWGLHWRPLLSLGACCPKTLRMSQVHPWLYLGRASLRKEMRVVSSSGFGRPGHPGDDVDSGWPQFWKDPPWQRLSPALPPQSGDHPPGNKEDPSSDFKASSGFA